MSSFVKYSADGTQQLYTVNFPYLARAHVQVRANGILMLSPGDYEWQSSTQIRTRTTLPASTLVEIKRVTPDSALVNFINGSVLTEEDLNKAVRQALYRNEELRDELDGYVSSAISRFGFGGETVGMTPEELLAATSQTILESSLLANLQEHISDIETNAESIIDQTIRLDDFQTLVESIAYVDGQAVGTFAANEKAARIEGDEALQTQLALIGAKSGDGLAWILDLDTVKVSSTESLATRLTSIASTLGDNAAAITTEQSARTDADDALATSISGVAAAVADNAAAISIEATARADGDSANATSITNLAADVAENSAAIESIATVIAEGGYATATQVDTLQATVDGHTSSLSTLSEVVAGSGGLTAQYMVKLDVNGYVTGFGQYNDGSSSHFYIVADRFAIVNPGFSPTVPFFIDEAGVTHIQNVEIDGALIKDATIGSAQIATLSVDTLKLTNLAVTRAKIANAAIGSAQIDNLAVTTAHIQNAAVDKLKIAGQSVFVPLASTVSTNTSVGASVTLTISPDDIPSGFSTIPIIVSGTVEMGGGLTSQGGASSSFFLDLRYATGGSVSWAGSGNIATYIASRNSVCSATALVNLGAGTYTFGVNNHGTGSSNSGQRDNTIVVLVAKR